MDYYIENVIRHLDECNTKGDWTRLQGIASALSLYVNIMCSNSPQNGANGIIGKMELDQKDQIRATLESVGVRIPEILFEFLTLKELSDIRQMMRNADSRLNTFNKELPQDDRA